MLSNGCQLSYNHNFAHLLVANKKGKQILAPEKDKTVDITNYWLYIIRTYGEHARTDRPKCYKANKQPHSVCVDKREGETDMDIQILH